MTPVELTERKVCPALKTREMEMVKRERIRAPDERVKISDSLEMLDVLNVGVYEEPLMLISSAPILIVLLSFVCVPLSRTIVNGGETPVATNVLYSLSAASIVVHLVAVELKQ